MFSPKWRQQHRRSIYGRFHSLVAACWRGRGCELDATGTFYLLMLALGFAAARLAGHLGLGRLRCNSVWPQLSAAGRCGLRRAKSANRRNPIASADRDVNLDIGETIFIDKLEQPTEPPPSSTEAPLDGHPPPRRHLWSPAHRVAELVATACWSNRFESHCRKLRLPKEERFMEIAIVFGHRCHLHQIGQGRAPTKRLGGRAPGQIPTAP